MPFSQKLRVLLKSYSNTDGNRCAGSLFRNGLSKKVNWPPWWGIISKKSSWKNSWDVVIYWRIDGRKLFITPPFGCLQIKTCWFRGYIWPNMSILLEHIRKERNVDCARSAILPILQLKHFPSGMILYYFLLAIAVEDNCWIWVGVFNKT